MDKKLKYVKSYPVDSAIIKPKALPVYKGNEPENLLCGNCSTILIEGISEQTMLKRFIMPAELFINCPSFGGYNHVAVQVFKISK